MRRIVRFVATLALTAPVHAAEPGRVEIQGLRLTIPTSWVRTPASSNVRAAQYRVPRAGTDTEDGEFVVFFFGKGKGGGLEENLSRWYDQFSQPDGRSSREAAVVTSRTVRGLKVTAVDLSGTYRGMAPGSGPPTASTRMLAAVVEGAEGPWFLKATGPATTMAEAKPGFDALLLSLEPH